MTAAAKALATRGAELVAVETNPIDAVWPDQPAPSDARLIVQPDTLAGVSAATKRQEIADMLTRDGVDVVVLSALDSIAWAFNVRGQDVSRTPVALAYALVRADATADLFVDPGKIDEAVAAHLGNAVRVQPREVFAGALAGLGGQTVTVDPDRAVAAIFEQLAEAGAHIVEARDPVVLPKAIKNRAEIAGTTAAHVRDGAAVTRFLPLGRHRRRLRGQDELTAAARLEAFRAETGALRDLSFDTISGAGPNGAVVHYRVSEATVRPIEPGTLYLVDSGGQYADGTTDITRTLPIGEPTAEMKDRFTRVLKGHIALARAVFPVGTRGGQLDALARQYLWAVGLDYAHGTGHGVGSYLGVHEGPQRIASPSGGQSGGDEPLAAGHDPVQRTWLLQDRRLWHPDRESGAGRAARGPRCRKAAARLPHADLGADRSPLVDLSLISADERDWLDAYHARVAAEIGPLVPADVRDWLASATAPLG